jgi:two-component system, LytTR family, response regulator
MINTIIVDDEQHCRDSLELELSRHCVDVKVLQKCADANEGIQAISQWQPDLVFLDVDMPWIDGFSMLETLEPLTFKVIFVTAFDKFAIRAFRFTAVDYLLKPVDASQLIIAVNRVKQVSQHFATQQLAQLQSNYRSNTVKKIAVPSKQAIEFYPVSDILYIEASGPYSKIFFDGLTPVLLSKNIGELEELLQEEGFFRVHHSYLVNLNHVNKYVRGDGGHLVMKDKQTVTVSRNKKEELLTFLTGTK